MKRSITFIVEHLEPLLYDWSTLEYLHMLEHVGQGNLIITLAPTDVVQDNTDTNVDASQEVEEHTRNIHRLTAAGAHVHIGSMDTLPTPINLARAALLDQCATLALSPADTTHFDYILCGGILGTDEMDGAPMVDRTAGVRRQGLECRHLGTVQMTADTAVIVAKRVLVDGQCMDGMKFSDRPSVEISKRERIEMPFRYLQDDATGGPLLPPGMLEHWRETDF